MCMYTNKQVVHDPVLYTIYKLIWSHSRKEKNFKENNACSVDTIHLPVENNTLLFHKKQPHVFADKHKLL